MNFLKQSSIFVLKLLWISLKYSPILIAWLLIGTLAIDTVSQMFQAASNKPPLSTWEQLALLLAFWFFITGAAALKSLSK